MSTDSGFRIRRTTRIEAPPEVVFDFFREPRLFAAWFGEGSRLDAKVGGEVSIRFPGGAEAVGEVLEVEAPHRIRLTWGYPGDGGPVPPGGSVVDVHVDADDAGSIVTLEHVLPTQGAADAHDGGWAYHLSRLAAKAARERFAARATAAMEAWFAAWGEDGDAREARLREAMVEDATYLDDAVSAPSREEVSNHIARCHQQMPGSGLERAGPLLQTGDRLACRAALTGPQGAMGHVQLVMRLAADGRIREAVGLFETPVPGVSDGPLLAAP